MTSHTCPRCKFKFNKISHYKDHLKKKNLCEGEGSLYNEYIKYDIDLEDRYNALLNYSNKKVTNQVYKNINGNIYNGDVYTTNNNITVNILPYEETKGITNEEVTRICNEIAEYNKYLINNDEATDGEYMVAFMTKAIENKMKNDKNISVVKSGRKNFVKFTTKDGEKKIDMNDGVAKICNDIETDYLENVPVASLKAPKNETDEEGDVRRTKYVIDKEIRREADKRDKYHEEVAKSLKK